MRQKHGCTSREGEDSNTSEQFFLHAFQSTLPFHPPEIAVFSVTWFDSPCIAPGFESTGLPLNMHSRAVSFHVLSRKSRALTCQCVHPVMSACLIVLRKPTPLYRSLTCSNPSQVMGVAFAPVHRTLLDRFSSCLGSRKLVALHSKHT
jgi:hypothetical protein